MRLTKTRFAVATAMALSAGFSSAATAATFIVDSVLDTVDAGDGVTTLREAITAANNAAGADTIVITVNGTVLLGSQLPTISSEMTIEGPGAGLFAIDGQDTVPCVSITGGPVALRSLTVQNGLIAGQGGGLIISGGAAIVLDGVRVTGCRNVGGSDGGGIRYTGFGSLALVNCLVDNNRSEEEGGGLDSNATGNLFIINSTFSNNTSVQGGAGAEFQAGSVFIHNSTFTANTAGDGGTGTTFGGGIRVSTGANVQIKDSIIAGNFDRAASPNDNITVVGGTLTSLGYNLIGENTGVETIFDEVGDQVGTSGDPLDPLLEPLSDNGGGTLSHAILATSPANNAGDPAFSPTFFTPNINFDQRGTPFARERGGRIDIGAFEVQGGLVGLTTTAGPRVEDVFVVTAVVTVTPVPDLVASNFTITNGTIENFSGTGKDYSFEVWPDQLGAIEVSVPAGQFIDSDGEWNVASNVLSVLFTDDIDADGITSEEEDSVPSDLDSSIQPRGDGNGDNIRDAIQPTVASFRNAATVGPHAEQYLTLVAPADTQLEYVSAVAAPEPRPENSYFPVGLISFEVTGNGLAAAPTTNEFRLILEEQVSELTGSYWKYSGLTYTPFNFPIPVNSTGASYDFDRTFTLRLIDNNGNFTFSASGDSDTLVGRISDPGGPSQDSPLAVKLDSFTSTEVVGGILLEWTTLQEINNAGFNIYRQLNNGSLVLVNSGLIPAVAVDGSGASYSVIDTVGAQDGELRVYFLEDVELGGTVKLHGPFSFQKSGANVPDWTTF